MLPETFRVAFTPDGKHLLAVPSRGGMTVDAEVDRMIAVVDLDSGETIHQIAFADEGEMPRNIYDIAVSPNGRFLAAISDDAARLWRIAD